MAAASILRPGSGTVLPKTSNNNLRCRNSSSTVASRPLPSNYSSGCHNSSRKGLQQLKRSTVDERKVTKTHIVSGVVRKQEHDEPAPSQERCRPVYSIPDLDATTACSVRKASGMGSVGLSGPNTNNSSRPRPPPISTAVSNSSTTLPFPKRNSICDNGSSATRLPSAGPLPSIQLPCKTSAAKSGRVAGGNYAHSKIPTPTRTHATLPRIARVVGKDLTQSTSTRANPSATVVPSRRISTTTTIVKPTVKPIQNKPLPSVRVYSENNQLVHKEQYQPQQMRKTSSTEIPRRRDHQMGSASTLPKSSLIQRKLGTSTVPMITTKTKANASAVTVPVPRIKPKIAPTRIPVNSSGSIVAGSVASRTSSLRAGVETINTDPSDPSISLWQPAPHASVPPFEALPACEWMFPIPSGGDPDSERWPRMGSQSSVPLPSCDRCISSTTRETWTPTALRRHQHTHNSCSETCISVPPTGSNSDPLDHSSYSRDVAIVNQPLKTISQCVSTDQDNYIAFDFYRSNSKTASEDGVILTAESADKLWTSNPSAFPLELCAIGDTSLNSNMLDLLTPQTQTESSTNTSWPANVHRYGMLLDQVHVAEQQQHSASSSVTTSPRSSLQSDPANDLGYSSEKLPDEEDEEEDEANVHNFTSSGHQLDPWCSRAKSNFEALEEAIVQSGRLNSIAMNGSSHNNMDLQNSPLQNESCGGHDTSQVKDIDILDDLFKFVSKDRLFHVMIQKTGQGLGLSVSGGIEPLPTDNTPPGPAPAWAGLIRIKKIFPYGAAWATGQLEPGDLLLTANQTTLTGLTNHEALEVLRTCPQETLLTVCRLPWETACRLGLEIPGEHHDALTVKTVSPSHNLLSLQFSYSSLGEFEATLTKVNGSLGFTLRKEDESVLGHYIRSLVKEPAISDGRLRAGDKILSVNNVDISSMSHKEAIAFLRRCPDTVSIRLFRDSALTPVSPTSPTELEPSLSFTKPKPLLRQEAQDLLHDLAVRKQAESRGASPSSGRNGSSASTGSVTPSSPRRRRLTKTPSPDLATVAKDRYGLDVFLSPLANTSMSPLHESDSEKDTSFTRNSSNLSGEYFTPNAGNSAQKTTRPDFLNLNNFATKKQKFLFTPPQEDSNRTLASSLHERIHDNASPVELDPCSEPREAGDGSTNSDSEFTPPELSNYVVNTDSSKLEPLEPFSLNSEWTDLSIDNEDKLSRMEDGTDTVDSAGFTRHAPLGLSDRDKSPPCVNYSTEVAKASTGPSKGLLKWKGVLFTPEEELPPSSLVEDSPSLCESHGEMDLDDFHATKRGKVMTVELNKGWNSRLGFSVTVDKCKASVGAIYEDSVAAKDGRLQVGDEILKVNNDYVEGLSKEEIIDLLRKTRGPVSITVRKASL